jgi:hypothetical protein
MPCAAMTAECTDSNVQVRIYVVRHEQVLGPVPELGWNTALYFSIPRSPFVANRPGQTHTHTRAVGHRANVRGREICHRQDEKAWVMHWAFGNLEEQRSETKNTAIPVRAAHRHASRTCGRGSVGEGARHEASCLTDLSSWAMPSTGCKISRSSGHKGPRW